MKKIIKFLPIALLVGAGISFSPSTNLNAADTIYTGSALPSTINLNDCSSTEIRSYYASLNSNEISPRYLLLIVVLNTFLFPPSRVNTGNVPLIV